ncbi:MAG: hypothetical protein ACK4QL_07710 [Pseudanabaenaceae cyanobacterium]
MSWQLAPMVLFVSLMLIVLVIAFALSYLFWSDRYKTPEVIAAEVGYITERISSISLPSLALLGAVLLFMVVSQTFPLSSG